MLAQSALALGTTQEAFCPKGPHKPHQVTANLEGTLGTNARTWLQGGCTAGPTWEASRRPERKEKGSVCRGGGEGKHYLPFCLKKLSSKSRSFFRIRFFSSLISWRCSKSSGLRGGKNFKKIELNLSCPKCNECAAPQGEARKCKNHCGNWGSAEMGVFCPLKCRQQLWLWGLQQDSCFEEFFGPVKSHGAFLTFWLERKRWHLCSMSVKWWATGYRTTRCRL